MRRNFFISYDLMYPGQHYDKVREAIRSLGLWHQFQYSLFYVNTSYTAQQAFAIVRDAMDRNDRLLVVDAFGAVVDGLSQSEIDTINTVWFGLPKRVA